MKDLFRTMTTKNSLTKPRPTPPREKTHLERHLSLRVKLPLAINALLALAFFVATYASVLSARSSLTDTLKNNLVTQATLEANLIRSYLVWTRSFAIDLAATTETSEFNEQTILDTIQRSLTRNEQIFGSTIAYEPYRFQNNLYYWSPYYSRSTDGTLRFTQLGNREYNYFRWDWYKLPKARNEPVLSPPYFDEGGGEIWMVTWSAPFYNKSGDFMGVTTADIAFSQTQDIVRQIVVGNKGYAFLIDPQGAILGIGDNGGKYNIMEDTMLVSGSSEDAVRWNSMIQQMTTEGGRGFVEVVNPQGNPVFVAFEPIGMNTNWSLGLAFSRAELFQPVNQLQNTLIAISFAVLLLSSVISLFVTRAITLPIQRLSSHAKAFSRRDAPSLELIQIRTHDELEDLGNSFNQMTKELSSAFEMLEERVLERTRDLEIAKQNNERRARQFEAVAQVARAITSTQDADTLLSRVSQLVSQYFGFYHVGIFFLDDNREYAVLVAASSEGGKKMLARGHRLRVGEMGIVGAVAASGNPRIALDTGQDAVFFDNPDLPHTHSELAIPLKKGGRVIGALDVQSTEPSAFTNEDITSLSILADQVSIAIENARLYETTRKSLEQTEAAYRQYVQNEWTTFAREEKLSGFHYVDGNSTPLEVPMELGGVAQIVNAGNIHQSEAGTDGKPAQLAIPVKLRGEVIGVLRISTSKKSRWTDDDIDIVEAVAERLALALENARLFHSSANRATRERIVSDISSKISGNIRIKDILQMTAQELSQALNGMDVLIQLQPGLREESQA